MMKRMIRTLMFLMLLVTFISVPVHASEAVSLSIGKKYTNLDFNGDGKKDSFYYTYNRNNGKISLHLNGTSQKLIVGRGAKVTYYKQSASRIFLFITAYYYGGGDMLTYKYVGNRIKPVNSNEGNLNVMSRTLFHHASGEYVYLEDSPYHQYDISSFKKLQLKNYDTTTFLFKYKYNAKSGKFVRASRYAKTLKPYSMTYTGKTFKTSSSPKKINKKGVKLKHGAKVKLVQVYAIPKTINSNGYKYTTYTFRFKIKYKGKYGWFTNSLKRSFS